LDRALIGTKIDGNDLILARTGTHAELFR